MSFEAPQNFENENHLVPPVVEEVDSSILQGIELEAAFKAGAIQEEDLTKSQRLELHNKGYNVTLPEGEVTLH